MINPATNTGRGGVGLGCYFNENDFLEILRLYVIRMLEVVGVKEGELFLEKTPKHALTISEIRAVLPSAKIIHIVRDPRDVVASLLAASKSWGVNWAPGDTDAAAALWLKYITKVNQAASELSDQDFLEVSYEDLWASPPDTLARIFSFMKVEFSEALIEKAIKDNSADSMKAGGGTPIEVYGKYANEFGKVVNEPRGFVRKARPEAGRELSLIQKFILWRRLRGAMEQKGYFWSTSDWINKKMLGRISKSRFQKIGAA